MDEDLDRWFIREIVAHEAALTRYIARIWSDPSEAHDIRQDAYIRVYESAANARPNSPKSFLFQTARNLMVDRRRRQRVVSIECVEDLEALHVSVDELSPERRLSALQELRLLAAAFNALPSKCRNVVWLRRVEGLSQREVAQRLNIGETTVEKHVARGVKALANVFFGARPVPQLTTSTSHSPRTMIDANDQQQPTD